MSDFNRGFTPQPTSVVTDMSVDAGPRSFMLGVYNKVGLGLVLSAALAWVTGTYPPVQALLFSVDEATGRLSYTLLGMVVAFAPLVILLSQMFMRRASPAMAAFTYWSIVSLIGASFGLLFIVYSGVSIFETFLVTACAFGGLSLVGYTTKRDLTAMGSFLIMGLFGLIFAMLASFFFQSPALTFGINLIGVLIFAGLIAYDTQRLKVMYHQVGGDGAAMSVATNYGALSLYLDFVNLFRFLLYFMGGSRR
jgi:FtsH-binding integral membrane protein